MQILLRERKNIQASIKINNDKSLVRAHGPHEMGVGSAPALGAGGREFESRHSDMIKTHDATLEIWRLSWVFLFDVRGEIARLCAICALLTQKLPFSVG